MKSISRCNIILFRLLRRVIVLLLLHCVHFSDAIDNNPEYAGYAFDTYGTGKDLQNFEKRMADLLGKPAALFFPTGTLANKCALLAHAHGSEV